MTAEQRDRRALEIFVETCGLAADARAALLERACDGDAELRQRVESMLAADAADIGPLGSDADVDAFLVRHVQRIDPAAAAAAAPGPTAGAEPVVDGEYTILRVIGEGGMGTVYEAEQHHPRRRVAVKAIRPGRLTPQTRKRFEYEAQVLARLEHPGIARLYESNTQVEGGRTRAFLAMELVEGEPIDAHAAAHQLDVPERLRVFLKVCDAVAYAHRMGVIHRDLKPANILVNRLGEPKVLDFGVARTVDHDPVLSPAITQDGQIIGTLSYMSPEQVEGRAHVDTRADVYSLGTILYKLLSGALPIEPGSDNLLALTRRVITETPKRLGQHDKRLKGDLEVIVARALEKDPARRYAGVDQLRDEIERHLSGRPIHGRAGSRLYVIRKAVWRHRAATGAALLLVALLAGFGIYASLQADHNRRLAEAAARSRDVAVKSEARAANQANELRRSLYLNNIGFAQSALDNNDMERAHSLLDHCDPDLRGWEWGYLQRLCDLSEQTQELHLNRPRYAGFTRDRDRVVFATLGREIILLNTADRRELLREKLSEGTARAAISPDGRWLAFGGVVDNVALVELATGRRRVLAVHPRPDLDAVSRALRVLGFSADSRTLISGGLDGVLRTWDVGSAAQRKVINLGSASPVSMLIAPRGGWVAVGDGDGGVRLFDIRTGQLRHALRGHDAPVWSLAVSHDGTRLASGDSDAGAIVWDVAAGRAVTKLSTTNGWITSLCFSPDDTALAEGRADSTIRLLRLSDLSTGSILRGHRRAVVHVDWQPDGTLHTVSLDGTTKTWSAQSASQIPTIITGQPHCNALALSPDGRRIFVGGSDGTVRSWDLRPDENEPPAQGPQLPAHDRGVLEIAVSAAGNRVCSAGQDGVVHVSPLTGDGAVVTINPGSGSISAVDFSPDGSRLVLGTAGEISLWDAGSGNKLRDYASKGVVPNEITFDASGNFFYAACADGHVRRWRTDSPAAVAEAMIDAAGVYDVRPSTDGRSVVATGDTQSVVLLDAATLQIARRFTGHQGAVFAAAFHPGGNRLATCGTDRTIRIWDLATGTELIALRGHRQSVQDIVFSADGRTLVSGGDDGTVKLWRTLPQ